MIAWDPAVCAEGASMRDDVRRGLSARPKTLPPYLFYDDAGSWLYERITELPEYYLTRAERGILLSYARELVQRVQRDFESLTVIELGAGSASKTEILLRAILEQGARCTYIPIDVSRSALAAATQRLGQALPSVEIHAKPATYERALRALGEVSAPRLVLFLGSSVGNMADDEASALLRHVRGALPGEVWLLLGTDLRKTPEVLRAAYDDAAGVTAAFNKNLLVRINRELGGHFDLDGFRHVARWNARESRVEMHLESTRSHEVAVDAIGLRIRFEVGETIHTESCAKYDLPRVERLLAAGGFARAATYSDHELGFAVHLGVSQNYRGDCHAQSTQDPS
jgi:dimethylhistidine N-methyltransferase